MNYAETKKDRNDLIKQVAEYVQKTLTEEVKKYGYFGKDLNFGFGIFEVSKNGEELEFSCYSRDCSSMFDIIKRYVKDEKTTEIPDLLNKALESIKYEAETRTKKLEEQIEGLTDLLDWFSED